MTKYSRLVPSAFVAGALAAAPAQAANAVADTPAAALRFQASALTDSRAAARSARRDSERTRLLVNHSQANLHKAYAITREVTKSSRAFQVRADAALTFSSGASSQVDTLLRVVARGQHRVVLVAADAVKRTVSMQCNVALSLKGLDESAATALDLLATQQSNVTTSLVDQASAGRQSRDVRAALDEAIARSTRTEAALNARIAALSG